MKRIVLIALILLAAVLRLYKLDVYPAFNADEAAIGYNAYSLIQTGKDEHSNVWPIHFQSFNDYKPGLYVYIVLPFVKLFGLNEWSVRIPGALIGIASVYLLYLISNELFHGKEFEIRNLKFGIWPALLLAINPWHIHFSRGGWEVNVATFFMILGLWLFLKGLKRYVYLSLSVVAFVLSLYTYHATRIVVPLLGLGLVVIYWKKIITNLKPLLLAGLVGIVMLIPLVKDFARPEITSRAAGVGLFADTGPLARINEQRNEHVSVNGFATKLLHNKAVNYSLAFLENWGKHYNGNFLFISGDDIQRDKVPETGQMYLFDILFLSISFIAIVLSWSKLSNEQKKSWKLIVWWIVISPVAAALTFQSPHALRAQNMVIPLVIISAFGLLTIIRWINQNFNKRNLLASCYMILAAFVVWNFVRYEHMYWVHMAKEYPFSSQYGVKELVGYVRENQQSYANVIVTDRYDQPYILFLFYLKYPPSQFQSEHILTQRDQYGFSTVRKFGKYNFESINWDMTRPNNPDSLIVGTPEEIPDTANIVKKIYGSNGYEYFDVVAN